MEEKIKADILVILQDAALAIDANHIEDLKTISDHTLHNSATFQDEDSISIAILIYSIAKICERAKKDGSECTFPIAEKMVIKIREAAKYLENNDEKKYRKIIHELFGYIKKYETKFVHYATEIMQQARIKKGSRITEHGLSFGIVSQLLGISKWELMDYLGHTMVYDKENIRTKTTKERLNVAKRLFKI
ncbi:hypothetical protein J4468_04055 [Candidatus Woesearchaeota archaeon]|nr:hypothetical protein [Candidatus Woesearchaeota archaeon]